MIQHYHGAEDITGSGQVHSENLWDDETECWWEPGTRSADSSSRFKSSDIDVFLYGMNADQAERKIVHILAVLGDTVTEINRTAQCVSFVRGWPHRNVQV